MPAYQRRIEAAREVVLRTLETCRRPMIAFSTGKDSTVMADLVWREDPTVPAVYFDADACYPESRALLDRYRTAGREIIVWKTEPILDTFARVGGPLSERSEAATMESTVYVPVREAIAEYGFDGQFVGLRAEEAPHRRATIRRYGQLAFAKSYQIWRSWPVAWLEFSDVWAYIFANKVDYSAVYDRQFELGLPWEECRLSYCFGETYAARGRWAVLARGWPDLYRQFVERFPEVAGYR